MIDDARKKVLIGTALHQARFARRCRYHAVVAKPELEFRNIRATGIAKVYWAARSGALDDLHIISYLVRRLTRVVRHAMSVCVKLQIESLPVHRCGLLRTDHVQNPLFLDGAIIDPQAIAKMHKEILLCCCCPSASLGRLIDAPKRTEAIMFGFESRIKGRIIQLQMYPSAFPEQVRKHGIKYRIWPQGIIGCPIERRGETKFAQHRPCSQGDAAFSVIQRQGNRTFRQSARPYAL